MRRVCRSRALRRFLRTVYWLRAAGSFAFHTGAKVPGARERASSASHRLMSLVRRAWPTDFHIPSGMRNINTMPSMMAVEIHRV